MTLLDLSIASLLILSAIFDEGDFVVPPHDIAPVRLIVFKELIIKFKVLTNTHDNVFRGHSRVRLIFALIPLALTEVEGTDAKGNVNDCTLFSSLMI